MCCSQKSRRALSRQCTPSPVAHGGSKPAVFKLVRRSAASCGLVLNATSSGTLPVTGAAHPRPTPGAGTGRHRPERAPPVARVGYTTLTAIETRPRATHVLTPNSAVSSPLFLLTGLVQDEHRMPITVEAQVSGEEGGHHAHRRVLVPHCAVEQLLRLVRGGITDPLRDLRPVLTRHRGAQRHNMLTGLQPRLPPSEHRPDTRRPSGIQFDPQSRRTTGRPLPRTS
jgi:hypothetical protein